MRLKDDTQLVEGKGIAVKGNGKGSFSRLLLELTKVLSNKSVQTIVVKQLRRVYIRLSFAGARGGGRTEMTSSDRETDSRWSGFERFFYPRGRARGPPRRETFLTGS